jgi:hypothetical protein
LASSDTALLSEQLPSELTLPPQAYVATDPNLTRASENISSTTFMNKG